MFFYHRTASEESICRHVNRQTKLGTYMVRKANQKSIPVLLCTVPVNIRDWLPTVSNNRLTGSQLAEWQHLYDKGRQYLLEARYKDGLDVMYRTIQLEPEHAESHFWYGRLLEAEGRFSEALQSYNRARDFDFNPFRAISAFNHTLRTIAQNNQKAILVDLEKTFYQASENGLTGFNLFLDYVHPNTEGNILIARNIFNVIADNPILQQQLNSTAIARGNSTFTGINKRYNDTFDLDIQTRLFYLYAMNHQYDAAVKKTRHIYHLKKGKELSLSDNSELDVLPLKIQEGYLAFQQYETAYRRALLKEADDLTEMDDADKKLKAYYDKWYTYGKY